MGDSGCRVTPVVDGLLLKQAQRRNGMGGEWLSAMQYSLFVIVFKLMLHPGIV